jgi:hypothetical protein
MSLKQKQSISFLQKDDSSLFQYEDKKNPVKK